MTALYVHLAILWAEFFGMVAFRQNALITRRSKQLGALVFVVIIVEAAAFSPQDERPRPAPTVSGDESGCRYCAASMSDRSARASPR